MKNDKVKFSIIGLIGALALILIVVAVYSYLKIPAGQEESNFENSGIDSIEVSGPRLKVTPESFDFGTVIYGEVARQSFELKNIGSQPLEILRLSTSCGCTTAEMATQDKTIAPGKTVKMAVSFDPAVHGDDHDLGPVVRVVYIKTNDSETPETEVEITAEVVKQAADSQQTQPKVISVTARQWEFSPNPIKVKKGDLVRLEITSVDVVHGFVLPDFNIDETIEPGKKTVAEFLADRAGTFSFFCSVPCGQGHGNMRGQLIVE